MSAKDILKQFLLENEEPLLVESSNGLPSPIITGAGKLLIGGCLDWNNATSKSPIGLESLLQITLGQPGN